MFMVALFAMARKWAQCRVHAAVGGMTTPLNQEVPGLTVSLRKKHAFSYKRRNSQGMMEIPFLRDVEFGIPDQCGFLLRK